MPFKTSVSRVNESTLIDRVSKAVRAKLTDPRRLTDFVKNISAGPEGKARGIAHCTNVLMRTPSGWRVVVHHASSAPPRSSAEAIAALH